LKFSRADSRFGCRAFFNKTRLFDATRRDCRSFNVWIKILALRYRFAYKFKRSRRFKTAAIKFYRTLGFSARYLHLILGICDKILA
jgi:hypothetical protein